MGCKRPARWGSSDAYAAPLSVPFGASADAGNNVHAAATVSSVSRAYPLVHVPENPRLRACITAFQMAKTADDFGVITDDASCTLSDVARLRWASLAKAPVPADVLRRRYASLGTGNESELLSARVSVARMMSDPSLLAKDLALGIDKGGLDRVEAYKELASLPASAQPSLAEMRRLQDRVWLAAPKRARLAKVPALASVDPLVWAELGRVWHGASDLKQAEAAWNAARTLASKKSATSLCAVELVRGGAYKHKGPMGLDAWTRADKACAGTEDAPRARFNLSRAMASAGKAAEARVSFLGLAAGFPGHRLADDALLKAASLTRDLEGEEAFRAALQRIVDGPKDADMRSDACSLLYVSYARSGAWEQALQVVMQMETRGASSSVWSGGKVLYLRGRALEALARPDDAWSAYAEVLQSYPGAFYMRLAATRALRFRPAEALALWEKKRAADGARDAPNPTFAFMAEPCFLRANALFEVGEQRRAIEAGRACAMSDKAAVSSLALGVWYMHMGAFDKARGVSLGPLLNTSLLPEQNQFLPWAVAFPRAYEPLVREAAAREQVSPALVWSIMREESSFVPDVVSPTGALGLMQLMPGTAAEVAKGTPWSSEAASLKTPAGNIPLGTRLLGHLNSKYAGNEVLVASAYNAGEAATDRWLGKRSAADFDLWVEEIPYDETFGYVRRVASSAAVYRATHLGLGALADYALQAPAVRTTP